MLHIIHHHLFFPVEQQGLFLIPFQVEVPEEVLLTNRDVGLWQRFSNAVKSVP
jgi:hypothetical protein